MRDWSGCLPCNDLENGTMKAMLRSGAAVAALLVAGAAHATIVTSISASLLSPDFKGAVVGSTYITFEDVAAGTGGAFTSGIASFSGDGFVETGKVVNKFAAPAGDTTNYLATGFIKKGLNVETATFSTAFSKFGLYWGSIDSYNKIIFKDGATTIF